MADFHTYQQDINMQDVNNLFTSGLAEFCAMI